MPRSAPKVLFDHPDTVRETIRFFAESDVEELGYLALNLVDDLVSAYEQIDEYQQIIDLGYTRTQEATALWRAESPADRANVMPDLGDLLEWLIERGNSEVPEPCQPIGCDNGYHLPGCAFAEVDAAEDTDQRAHAEQRAFDAVRAALDRLEGGDKRADARCGCSVLDYNGTIYGPAVQEDCPQVSDKADAETVAWLLQTRAGREIAEGRHRRNLFGPWPPAGDSPRQT